MQPAAPPRRTGAPRPSDARDSLRLFVTLWPDADARDWLRACDAAIGWPVTAAREGETRWHLTLHFLGAVPRARIADLLPTLQQPFAPFDLTVGTVLEWPRGLLVVEPAQPPAALFELHATLGSALQRAGQRIEARPLRPHVTLARRAARAALPAPPAPQRWLVDSFALVASAAGRYADVALYPGGVLSRAADLPPATARTPPGPPPRPR